MPRLGDAQLKNGVIVRSGAYTPKWMSNIGFSYSAGIFKLVDAKGNIFSPLNPGFITMPSVVNPGQQVTLKITHSYEFHDAASGSSDLTNFGFGVNETIDSPADVYFYIGAANRADTDFNGQDGNSCLFLARQVNPETPSSSNSIGDLNAIPVTDAIDSILMMLDLTIANYTNLLTQIVLSFRMRWATAPDDWTVQTLDPALDQVTSQNIGTAWPAGTVKMPFYMAAAPLGWVLDTTVNDAFIRIVNTAGGTIGGAFADLTHTHTLAHTHNDGTLRALLGISQDLGFQDTMPVSTKGAAFLGNWLIATGGIGNNTTNVNSDAGSVPAIAVEGDTGAASTSTTSGATWSINHNSDSHAYANFIICTNG